MDATDARDQSSDAEGAGVPEATDSAAAANAAPATGTSEDQAVVEDVGTAEGTNLADILTDLGKAAKDTAATLSDTVGDGEAAVRAGLEEAESTIRQHPLLAVGIAAGVGFVLGLLLRGSGSGQSDDA